MPALSRHNPERDASHDAGFTLVEVMIVVFIIALMSAVVMVNLPSTKPGAVRHADALQRDLTRAAREAIVSGEPVALATRGGSYRFERYRAGYWSPAGEVVRARGTAGPSIVLDVLRDGETRRRAAPTAESAREAAAQFQRQIVFDPVGGATPARIIITGDRYRQAITVSANGTITQRNADQTERFQ
ncbi:MAG: GspH/FimT family pseudopilin [Pseudomonadota bacterium]